MMAPLRIERNLRLFLVYRFLSTSYLFAPVFLLFFAARGLSITEITLLNTVYCATLLALEIPTGTLADRWGRKRAMVLGSLAMAGGALIDWWGHSFLAFALGEGLLALGMALTSGSDSAYLYDLLRDAGRADEYRRREGSASAAKLIGAALAMAAGGWLGGVSFSSTYLATAIVCLAATLVAMLLDEPPVRSQRQRPVLRHMGASLRAVGRHPPLLFAVLFSTLAFTLLRMGMYFYQPYLTRTGLDIGGVGAVMAVLSLAAAWGAHRVDRLRSWTGERLLVWSMPALLTVTYLVLAGWCAHWGMLLMLLQSALNGIYSPLSKEMLNREIGDSGQRATILSVESMMRRGLFGLFAPLVGLVIDWQGMGAGLLVCASLGAVGTAWLGIRRVKPEAVVVPLPARHPPPATQQETAIEAEAPRQLQIGGH